MIRMPNADADQRGLSFHALCFSVSNGQSNKAPTRTPQLVLWVGALLPDLACELPSSWWQSLCPKRRRRRGKRGVDEL